MNEVGRTGSVGEETLFEQLQRISGHRRNDERAYEFYDRVKGPRWDDHRSFVDRCYRNLPIMEKGQIRGQWPAGQDDQVMAMWWEMYLHESLRVAGFTVGGHQASESGKRVDFHAVKGTANFYVEAHRRGLSPRQRAAAIRKDELIAALNAIRLPGWRLHLSLNPWIHPRTGFRRVLTVAS